MNSELLIEAVRRCPALYDMSDSKYMDPNYKALLWVNIAKEMGETDVNCKKKWANIRDQFKRSLNKRKCKSGQSSTVIKKYKYEHNLQFLLPYIKDYIVNDYVVNVEEDFTQDTNESGMEDNQLPQEMEIKPEQGMQEIQTWNDLGSDTGIQNEQDNEMATKQLNSERINRFHSPRFNRFLRSSARSRRYAPHTVTTSDSMVKYILLNNSRKYHESKKSHPIDDFFNGLASTVKSFSPYYQHLAKGRLFAVVQELELEQMFDRSSPTSAASVPATILLKRQQQELELEHMFDGSSSASSTSVPVKRESDG